MNFDAIVIGSGFGGAISAHRLAEHGYRVLILERGQRWDRTNFPRAPTDLWLWNHVCPEHQPGWFDLRRFPHMTVAQGAGVGGGSLVYANVSCEAPPEVFRTGWPPEITYAELEPHYDSVKQFMNVRAVPEGQWTARMRLMQEAAVKAGFGGRFHTLELAITFDDNWTYEKDFAQGMAASQPRTNAQGAAQGTCVHLGDCDIGCDVGARNTLDLNYLYAAEHRYHAEIRPLHLVSAVEPLVGGYRVSYEDISRGQRRPGSETARMLIVAAGSLGSTELLLKCRDVYRTLPHISDRLGRNWSSNGDFLTPAIYWHKAIDASRGPTIASSINFLDRSQEGESFWIEDGGIANLAIDYLRRLENDPTVGFRAKLVLEWMKKVLRDTDPLRQVMPWFAQGVDAGNGTLRLQAPLPGGQPRLQLDWDIRESKKVIDAIVAMHKRLSAVTGGAPLVPITWSLLRDLITPHPLGGCNLGTGVHDGVVDHRGQVFGYEDLYVADGAIVPEALGVNPSRTIGALADRIGKLIVAAGR